MKTQEEIEQLAEKEYREYPNNPIDKEDWYYNKDNNCHRKRKAFVKGYTQCQKDMDDKKYTEKQLLDAMSFAECYIIEHDKPLFLKSDGKPVHDCLEYIKSLNKQD